MTRNRTALDAFSAVGSQLMVILLVVLAKGVGITEYFMMVRDRVRRVEVRLRRPTARRAAA